MNRAALLIVIAFIAVMMWLMLRTAASPLVGDYAEWTYHGVLLRDVLQRHPDAGYVLKNYPVPNSLTTVGLGLLMLVMPWAVAAKVWLMCEMFLGLTAAVQLLKAGGKSQGWQLLVLPCAVFCGTTFWFGFSNFNFGVYFAMLLCALLLRGYESRWIYGLLLVATFFSHMIPFGFAMLVLGLYAMQNARWRWLWQSAPSFLLSAWYFIGRATHGDADAHAGMSASVPYMAPVFAVFKVNTYVKCWGFINPASSDQDSILLRLVGAKMFVILFLLSVAIALGVLVLLARSAVCAIREKAAQRFFWIATAIFFFVALVMPGAAAGISDPGGRMMQVAVWCGVCVVATKRAWTGAVLGSCAFVLMVVNCCLLGAVAMHPPMQGKTDGPLPERLRVFAHVYYADRWFDYDAIAQHRMDAEIFPTAMFLKVDPEGTAPKR